MKASISSGSAVIRAPPGGAVSDGTLKVFVYCEDRFFQIARRVDRAPTVARRLLAHHTGHEPRFSRPPFSARNDRSRQTIGEAGQVPVHWSVCVNDGRSTTEEIVEGLTRGLEPGGIIPTSRVASDYPRAPGDRHQGPRTRVPVRHVGWFRAT